MTPAASSTFDEPGDLERRVGRQRRDERAGEVVQIEVGEAVAFRLPDESLVVLQELHRRPVVDPAGRPLFADDDPRRAGLGVRGDELQDVLAAIGAVEQQLAAVGRPRHAVDVVADDGVVERLAVAHVDLRALLRGDVVDPEVDDRVGGAGLRIRLDVVRALNLGLIELQVVVEDLLLVEAVVGDLAAVGRPPDRARLSELLAVHPARRAVLDAVLVVAVGRDGRLVGAGDFAHPQVAIAIEGFELAVGRIGRRGLTSALDARPAPAAAAPAPAAAGRRVGRRAELCRGARSDIEAIALAVEHVLDAAAVCAPRAAERARAHGAIELRAHLLVLRVARHRLQAILGARRHVQEGEAQQAERQCGPRAGDGPWQLAIHVRLLQSSRKGCEPEERRARTRARLFSLYNIGEAWDKSDMDQE